MGIDIPDEDNSKEFCEKNGIDGKYIVYCGRIEENKGIKMLVEYVLPHTALCLVSLQR